MWCIPRRSSLKSLTGATQRLNFIYRDKTKCLVLPFVLHLNSSKSNWKTGTYNVISLLHLLKIKIKLNFLLLTIMYNAMYYNKVVRSQEVLRKHFRGDANWERFLMIVKCDGSEFYANTCDCHSEILMKSYRFVESS